MFTDKGKIEPFASKVWLASPTMHGEELKYVTEAYETNWIHCYKCLKTCPIKMSLSQPDTNMN